MNSIRRNQNQSHDHSQANDVAQVQASSEVIVEYPVPAVRTPHHHPAMSVSTSTQGSLTAAERKAGADMVGD